MNVINATQNEEQVTQVCLNYLQHPQSQENYVQQQLEVLSK